MLKQTIVRLTPDLHKRAKLAAVAADISLQQLIFSAVEAYLQANKEVER